MIKEAVKPNIGYVQVTYRALRQSTFLGALCRSVVESFGRGADGCKWGYAAFREKLRISRSTVWRKSQELKNEDGFEVGSIGENNGQIRYNKQLDGETHITVLNWFKTEEFLFVYKDKKGDIVKETSGRLNNVEVALLSFIYTHRNDTNNCEGTYREFAGILHTTPESICRAAKRLRAAGLIKRIKKGWNGGKNRFTIDYSKNSVFAYAEAQHRKKEKKEQAKGTENAAQKQANVAPSPAAYYKELAKERRERAERYAMQVYEQVPAFERIQTKIDKITDEDLKKAMKSDPFLYYALTKKKKELLKERAELAAKMNINIDRFNPDYYGKQQCELCSGTGKLPQGTYCKCFTNKWRQM